MILDLIRNETRDHHQYLEKLIIPQIKNVTTKDDYIQLLNLFYGYFNPVESAIHKHIGNTIIPHFATRRKSSSIIKDIEAISGKPMLPKLASVVPEIKNEFQALGALYVLEGSTLGGKIISKMLKQNLQTESDEGFSFFSGYENDSEKYWHSFTQTLDTFTPVFSEQSAIAKSAADTFIYFTKWVQSQDANSHLK